jgi:O-antigen/teichoic acid export membrane protein
MIGAVAAAVYAVGGQINTLYISLSTAISSVFTPRVNRMVAEGCSDKALSGVFIRVGKIQFGTLLLILSGFAVFGRRFMSFWAGEGYEESFFVALILLCGYTVDLIQNVGIEIQRAKGYQKYRSLVNSIAAALNLGVSILLIPKLGATGAAIGTAVIWTVSCGLVTNLIYAKVISLSVGRFWREILRMSVGGILPLALGVVALPLINTCPLPIYFLLIAAFVLLYACSMYLLGLRRSERTALVTSLGRFALRRAHHQDTEV